MSQPDTTTPPAGPVVGASLPESEVARELARAELRLGKPLKALRLAIQHALDGAAKTQREADCEKMCSHCRHADEGEEAQQDSRGRWFHELRMTEGSSVRRPCNATTLRYLAHRPRPTREGCDG